MRRLMFVALAACGSSAAPATKTAPAAQPQAPAHDDSAAREQAHHDQLAAAHRRLEEEQQTALAATCPKDDKDKHDRCLPSCYPTEPADARAGKKLAGAVEIAHLVCDADGAYVLADELDAARLGARQVRGRLPTPHRKGAWQADVEAALVEAQLPKPAHGDVIVVTGVWRSLEHPLTKERLRCVTAAYTHRALRKPLDGCGGDGSLACEATGNPTARAINVVHYRLAEARRLQAAGKSDDCQQAALEAVAVARGLPRWRQYVKLNIGKWVDHPGYRTRFDGILDEDALFAKVASLGSEAEGVYAACGGPGGAPTTAPQEQSFHTCW